jgi:hypothetical protein
LASFFNIPIYPPTRGRIHAVTETLAWMGHHQAFSHHVDVRMGVKQYKAISGEDGFALPWPTTEKKLEFVKSAFPDVLQSPSSLLVPCEWVQDVYRSSQFPDDDTVEVPNQEFVDLFKSFVATLSFDRVVASEESIIRLEGIIRDRLDELCTRRHDPFYHVFVQFAARVSVALGH